MATFKITWATGGMTPNSLGQGREVEAEAFGDSADGKWIDFAGEYAGSKVLRVRSADVLSIELISPA